jgi:hypothetical protein
MVQKAFPFKGQTKFKSTLQGMAIETVGKLKTSSAYLFTDYLNVGNSKYII